MSHISVKCPTCGETIEADKESGRVISHSRKARSVDLEDVVKSLKDQAEHRMEMFQKSEESEKRKSERLDKLFAREEKRVHEEKDYGKFVRDIDLY